MDRQTSSTSQTGAQSELQFLLSLLSIAAPGQPCSQTAAIEQLLPVTNPR